MSSEGKKEKERIGKKEKERIGKKEKERIGKKEKERIGKRRRELEREGERNEKKNGRNTHLIINPRLASSLINSNTCSSLLVFGYHKQKLEFK